MESPESPESLELLDENVEIEYLDEVGEVSHNVKTRVSDLFFAETMQRCGSILFQKKQTPQIKELKKHALKEVMDHILVQKNIALSEDQIYKKINNMKTRVKAKTDLKRSENKEVKLNNGEKIFLHLMTTVQKSTNSTTSEEEFAVGNDGGPVDDDFDLQPSNTIDVSSTSHSKTQPEEKFGVGVKERPADEDFVPAQSKRVKLSHSITQENASSDEKKRKLDEREQIEEQSDPIDRSKLDVSELKKLVLIKKLDVLQMQKTLYEKADIVLDLFKDTFLNNK